MLLNREDGLSVTSRSLTRSNREKDGGGRRGQRGLQVQRCLDGLAQVIDKL